MISLTVCKLIILSMTSTTRSGPFANLKSYTLAHSILVDWYNLRGVDMTPIHVIDLMSIGLHSSDELCGKYFHPTVALQLLQSRHVQSELQI